MTSLETLQTYAKFFENLSLSSLEHLDDLVTEDVRFRDPLHELRGRSAVKQLLAAMLRSMPDVRFHIDDLALGQRGGFLSWTMRASFRRRDFEFEGVSVVLFSASGLVSSHVDQWDAASNVHAKIPVLGALIRSVNRHIAKASYGSSIDRGRAN